MTTTEFYRYGQILEMGMGNPLQAGTYYVGVISTTGTSPFSYTLSESWDWDEFQHTGDQPAVYERCGDDESGGSGGGVLLDREIADEPAELAIGIEQQRWGIADDVAGECALPKRGGGRPGAGAVYALYGGRKMQKAGNEQYLMMPVSGQSNIIAGTYYIGVASEGMNPSGSYLGTNSSSFHLEELWHPGGNQYRDGGQHRVGQNILVTNSNEGGQLSAFQFAVPPATLALQVSLENVVGRPTMLLPDGQSVDGRGMTATGWTGDRVIPGQTRA